MTATVLFRTIEKQEKNSLASIIFRQHLLQLRQRQHPAMVHHKLVDRELAGPEQLRPGLAEGLVLHRGRLPLEPLGVRQTGRHLPLEPGLDPLPFLRFQLSQPLGLGLRDRATGPGSSRGLLEGKAQILPGF